MGFAVKICFAVMFFILHNSPVKTLDAKDIIILIISQPNDYHYGLAKELKESIIKQIEARNKTVPVIYLSHENFRYVGDWTVLPLLPDVATAHGNNSTWLFVCTERTRVNIDVLLHVLSTRDHTQELWLGHGLYDRDATIIHHFAFYDGPKKFLYPNIASGFVMSMPLVKKISKHLKSKTDNSDEVSDADFSIDAPYELAVYILEFESGRNFEHSSVFCIKQQNKCATYVAPFVPCKDPVPEESVYFAVKTCSKFHDSRVSIVKKTWAKYVPLIKYFSDKVDDSVPTATLNVPNTNHGHCGKTMAIIRFMSGELKKNENIKWVIITDDDTIISSGRLRRLLSCYATNSSDHLNLVALGERYGYQVSNLQSHGYNYVTGGGGMVFGKDLVHLLAKSCHCPSLDSPDDMYLGVCLARLDIPVVHSPYFHQARPDDYAPEFLSPEGEAVSFHKHWMINPETVYRSWFEKDDIRFSSRESSALFSQQRKTEL